MEQFEGTREWADRFLRLQADIVVWTAGKWVCEIDLGAWATAPVPTAC